jgi:ketosteroid isomerase-like protein
MPTGEYKTRNQNNPDLVSGVISSFDNALSQIDRSNYSIYTDDLVHVLVLNRNQMLRVL